MVAPERFDYWQSRYITATGNEESMDRQTTKNMAAVLWLPPNWAISVFISLHFPIYRKMALFLSGCNSAPWLFRLGTDVLFGASATADTTGRWGRRWINPICRRRHRPSCRRVVLMSITFSTLCSAERAGGWGAKIKVKCSNEKQQTPGRRTFRQSPL
jgi:hypothetical protein